MKLFAYDAYASLTRVLAVHEPLVVVDVGANEGQTARRVLTEFPRATVHCFEPAPETFKLLERNLGAEARVRLEQVACGGSVGSVDFHVTGNHWCSSVLAPSDLGKRFYGDWYQTRQVVKVPMTTLDAWMTQRGVSRVDVLKVDAQGYDLEVLRGATRMLASGVKAINCECQFAPEYEGCATFSQIDQFLVSQGYALHQLHEVHDRGNEQQTTYGDGLWLRTDVLELLRRRTDLPDLSPLGRVRGALEAAATAGCARIALYGSGRHTRGIAEHLSTLSPPIVAIIDDNPRMHGERIGGIEVVSPSVALARGIDGVILSSDAHERALWQNSAGLRERGVRVWPLYDRSLDLQASAAHARAMVA
jgi:FkbM family methyltransferase